MIWILFNNTDNTIVGAFKTEKEALQFAQDNLPNDVTWTQATTNYLKKEADSNETK